jgi:DNA-directed RNA polymerase specialized sigma24 family protein
LDSGLFRDDPIRTNRRSPGLIFRVTTPLFTLDADVTSLALTGLMQNTSPFVELFEGEVVQAIRERTPRERAVLLLSTVGDFNDHKIHSIPLTDVQKVLLLGRETWLRVAIGTSRARAGRS